MDKFVFICLLFALGLAQVDYYSVLDLARDCSHTEVVKAHRRLSDRYNPDNNPGDREIARKYQQVQRAFEILSDWNKRNIYNQQGEPVVKMIERHQKVGRAENEQRTRDSFIEWQVPLEVLYRGGPIQFTLSKNVICPKCSGRGGKVATCPKCNGQGVTYRSVQMGPMTMQMQTTCEYCGGQGSWVEKKCPHCGGRKVVNENRQLTANVKAGMVDREEIVFAKEAEQFPGYTAGDLVFVLVQTPHATLERIGNNIYTELEISLEEALLGFSRVIKQLDGRELRVERNEVTQPFHAIVLKGEGMPVLDREGKFGDMHVTIKVKLPQMSAEELAKLKTILAPETPK